MQKQIAIKLFSIFILLESNLAFAQTATEAPPQQGTPEILNSLMTVNQQERELFYECGQIAYDPVCEQKIKAFRSQIKQLRKTCTANPSTPQCQSLFHKKKAYSEVQQDFCFSNPQDSKCVKKREIAMQAARAKRQFCVKKPDDPRCRSAAASTKPKRRKPTLAEFCEKRPNRSNCIALKKKKMAEENQDTISF
jgi:hypothetical protein